MVRAGGGNPGGGAAATRRARLAEPDPPGAELAQQGRRFTVNDGEIYATITDAQACFNLNAINQRGDDESAAVPYPAQIFTRLLENLGSERCAPYSSLPPCATGSMTIASRC